MTLAFIVSLFLLFLPLFLLLSSNKRNATSKKYRLPPSPPKLPIIGNLHQLGSLPYRSLRTLSEKYGPLLLLHMGQVPTLVASSPQMAREVLRTHDLVFASKPSRKVTNVMLRGREDLIFAPYGEYWRQARKLCVTHLLSAKMVQSFQKVREEEVALMIAKILRSSSSSISSVNMSEIVNLFSNDVICKAVSGKFFEEEGRSQMMRDMVDEGSAVIGQFHPSDCFPRLAWLDGLLTAKLNARTKRIAEKWDGVLEEVINHHVHQLKDGGTQKNGTDFVDVLLSLQKDSDGEFLLTKQDIKPLLFDMFMAGTDTSSMVLEWSLAELVRDPNSMRKLQDEVRGKMIRGAEMVREEDLSKMSYLKAVIKEVLRLHPPAPLLVPRELMEDCVVEGYEIPKKTRVMVNAWAIGRDPEFWEEPDVFRPERFIDSSVDFKGSDFHYIPFGSGRRICAGMNFGVSTVEVALANLVYRFDFEVPVGMKNGGPDMDEAPGLTARKKEELHLVAKLHVAL